MKIAYLTLHNIQAPEYQHFEYFSRVAQKNGCEAFLVGSQEEILAIDPDFVFVFGSFFPKLTHHPHYGVVQCPQEIIMKWPVGLAHTYTWDGYLTTSRSTEIWLREMLAHRFKDDAPMIGRFYVSADLQPFEENYKPEKLVYAGIGWDNRGIELFTRLYELLGDRLEIYGKPHFWEPYNLPFYKGFVETTNGLLDHYRRAAVLSFSNPLYLRDDVMTTRMHEASSVGAVTIAPRTPTTMLMYGETLYYYDGFASAEAQAQEIADLFNKAAADPQRDVKRKQAHDIFNATESLTFHFPALLRYHDYMQARRRGAVMKAG